MAAGVIHLAGSWGAAGVNGRSRGRWFGSRRVLLALVLGACRAASAGARVPSRWRAAAPGQKGHCRSNSDAPLLAHLISDARLFAGKRKLLSLKLFKRNPLYRRATLKSSNWIFFHSKITAGDFFSLITHSSNTSKSSLEGQRCSLQPR